LTVTRPRVLFVGPMRYRLPLNPGLEKKWAGVEHLLDVRILARGQGSDRRFELVASGFYSSLPLRVRRVIRDFRPHAIVAEDPRTATLVMSGRALAGAGKTPVIAEVHGNWRHATRLYGSPARRLLSPLVDALDAYGVRRADATRALSGYTAGLVGQERGKPPDAVFPTYSDLSAFTARPVQPLPERPSALFVGVLEPYKNVDGLAEAWRRAAPQVSGATLVVVGKGSRHSAVDRLVADGLATHFPELPPDQVSRHLDEATLLVLPSRFEGLGRVVIEAFARGRGVVASSAGGILDLVDDGEQGLLVDPEDVDGLTAALVRVLSDRALAERLGVAAEARFPEWNQTPDQFAERLRALVDSVIGARPL
jgi:glycosyltransferase involved in cell wall biosynthesis